MTVRNLDVNVDVVIVEALIVEPFSVEKLIF